MNEENSLMAILETVTALLLVGGALQVTDADFGFSSNDLLLQPIAPEEIASQNERQLELSSLLVALLLLTDVLNFTALCFSPVGTVSIVIGVNGILREEEDVGIPGAEPPDTNPLSTPCPCRREC